MRVKLGSIAAALVLAGASHASADTIYAFTASTDVFSVSGTITTDGATGTLSLSDIVSWQYSYNVGVEPPLFVSSIMNDTALLGNALTATATNLLWNFDDPAFATFFMQSASGIPSFSFLSAGDDYPGDFGSFYLNLGGFYDVPSSGDSVIASVTTTPLPAALPLFASGLGALGLLGWRRKRKALLAA